MKAQFNFFTLWKRDNSFSLAAGKLNPTAVPASFEQSGANSGAQKLMREPVQEAEAWRGEVGVRFSPPFLTPSSFLSCALSAGRGSRQREEEQGLRAQHPHVVVHLFCPAATPALGDYTVWL